MTKKAAAPAVDNYDRETPPEKVTWKCRGYGVFHGVRRGRMWFACSCCRWKAP
jgi:hypothetical protein